MQISCSVTANKGTDQLRGHCKQRRISAARSPQKEALYLCFCKCTNQVLSCVAKPKAQISCLVTANTSADELRGHCKQRRRSAARSPQNEALPLCFCICTNQVLSCHGSNKFLITITCLSPCNNSPRITPYTL